jgi:hypothetical protein
MAREKHRSKQELDSLIPTLKSEEKHLSDLLAETRERADAMVRDAEARAAARIQAARDELPGTIEAERRARHAALVSSAAEAARAETEKTRELERRARAAMDAVVRYIVSLVWPGAAPPGPPSAAPR